MNSFPTSANQFLILEKKTEHLFKFQILSLKFLFFKSMKLSFILPNQALTK